MPPISEDARDAQGTEDQSSPLYVKLKDYVRSRVEAGEWKIGQRVPSENELVDILGVSRM
ncbi:MAG TPA: histidine utilization repressor, partial [Agrobacterium sp.]|nr:histidine utilization repressor [Agrobacterium sp.]